MRTCAMSRKDRGKTGRQMDKPFRVKRLRDGLFYKGPMHKNAFTQAGKRFKTRSAAQKLIDDFRAWDGPLDVDNGPLEIVYERRT